jgi:hypothetical protein
MCIIGFLVILFLILILFFILKIFLNIINKIKTYRNKIKTNNIIKTTDKWFELLIKKDKDLLYDMFYKKNTIIVKLQDKETIKNNIKFFLDYFIKIPKIKILKKEYNISKISDNIYINTVFISWEINNSFNKNLNLKFIFIFKNNLIFELHFFEI